MQWLSDNRYGMLPVSHRAVAWADSQVGVREAGRNRGRQVERYQEAAGLGTGGGFAWCASFVYWCMVSAGAPPDRLPVRGQCAAVRNWVSWAKGRGRLSHSPVRGSLFFWLDQHDRGHIGFCLGPSVFGVFRTIEGNTDGEAGSREGDGVYKRTRSIRLLKRFPQWGFINLNGL